MNEDYDFSGFDPLPADDRRGGWIRPGGPQAAEPKRESVFFPLSALANVDPPDRVWLVDNMIPSGTVTLLGGDGAAGKSLLAAQLSVAVAASDPATWIGRPVMHGAVVFVSAEDDADELHRRFAVVAKASRVDIEDLDRLSVRSLAGEDALLAVQEGRSGVLRASGLYDELDRHIADVQPVLVVLDTLADLFPGNENDRAQARQFIGLLRALAIKHDCAVVLLAHPSQAGLRDGSGVSGSTAWNNSVRSRLYLERVVVGGEEANVDARMLSTKKANYGPKGEEITLTWREGVFEPDAPEYTPGWLDKKITASKAERVFLKLLRLFTSQGRRVNSGGGQNYAPNVFATHPKSEGVSKRGFRVAMETLLEAGRIANHVSGPASKQRAQLVELAS
ncbi:AAA family ATPase [Haematobacter sp.]|uniref:AAA family ATPase n=1 Tax=Haematobacter sp. TaxID=2953762 RepID=UPI0028AC1A2F|nr:AAA family ATPase [Haematobacter sp.]